VKPIAAVVRSFERFVGSRKAGCCDAHHSLHRSLTRSLAHSLTRSLTGGPSRGGVRTVCASRFSSSLASLEERKAKGWLLANSFAFSVVGVKMRWKRRRVRKVPGVSLARILPRDVRGDPNDAGVKSWTQVRTHSDWQAHRLAGTQAGWQARRQAGRHAGRLAGRHAGGHPHDQISGFVL
jgi:hypothetical protein